MRRPSHRRHDRDWPRRRDYGVSFIESCFVLKEMYPQSSLFGGPEYARPWWSKLAYARNWIDADDYYAIDEEPTGRVLPERSCLFDESPFFKLIRKDTSFATSQETPA